MRAHLLAFRAQLSCTRTALLASVLSVMLAVQACGGGESEAEQAARQQTQIDTLIQQADAKASEAKALGVDTPCDSQASTNQCGGLWLSSATMPCAPPVHHPYATQSPTAAAAEQAATVQRQLAAEALQLKFPTASCPAVFPVPPVFICRANRCIAEAAALPA